MTLVPAFRPVVAAAAAALMTLNLAAAQSPQFAVATIKRNMSGALSSNAQLQPGGRLTLTNTTIRDVMKNVFNLPDFAIVGGPAWLATDRYDIIARADGDPSREQMLQMLRALLIERFRMVTHQDTREVPVFALVLARPDGRLGPRLTRTVVNCATPDTSGRSACGFDLSGGALTATGMPLERLVRTLAGLSGRTVVDKTGLTGLYDVSLTWTPDAVDPTNGPGDAPALSTALQEQLGLKLESTRSPVQVLVIDSADRPTED